MKKFMSLMLGLSLVIGATSIAFAQGDDTKKDETKKKKKKKKADDRSQVVNQVR